MVSHMKLLGNEMTETHLYLDKLEESNIQPWTCHQEIKVVEQVIGISEKYFKAANMSVQQLRVKKLDTKCV